MVRLVRAAALEEGLPNRSWARILSFSPYHFSSPTGTPGQTHPEAEGKGAWLMCLYKSILEQVRKGEEGVGEVI